MTQKTETSRFRPTPSATTRRNRRAGFTLIELAVALTIILMIVTMVIPTLSKMLSSRAQMEAFNLVAAQLTAARSEAITGNTYAGIHVQLGAQTDMERTTYSMLIGIPPGEIEKDNLVFTRLGTFMPQELPGGTTMGQLTAEFVKDRTPNPNDPNDTDDAGEYQNISTDSQLRKFCAFSVIFSPDGSAATKVKDTNIMFASNDKMFNGDTKLWDYALANDKPGITVFTMFNYQKVFKLDPADRKTYLKENGQFLPVNMNTGQLFDRY